MLVRHVAVREHDLVNRMLRDDRLEIRFRHDRYPFGIGWTAERSRISPGIDARYLGSREGDDTNGRLVSVSNVEVMEIAPGGAKDKYAQLSCRVVHGSSLRFADKRAVA
jgi:hypothetical protein